MASALKLASLPPLVKVPSNGLSQPTRSPIQRTVSARFWQPTGNGPGWPVADSTPRPTLRPALPYRLAWDSSGRSSWRWERGSPRPSSRTEIVQHRCGIFAKFRQRLAKIGKGPRSSGSWTAAGPDRKNIRQCDRSACSQAGGVFRNQSRKAFGVWDYFSTRGTLFSRVGQRDEQGDWNRGIVAPLGGGRGAVRTGLVLVFGTTNAALARDVGLSHEMGIPRRGKFRVRLRQYPFLEICRGEPSQCQL